MGKSTKWLAVLLCLVLCASAAGLLRDKITLSREVIRLHVVANSDSDYDQTVKLLVRDAVTDYLRSSMANIRDAQQAKEYVSESMNRVTEVANDTLSALGIDAAAKVTFCREEFPIRYYDSFTLPAGVYDSLRITIGEGEGRNWWCVVFPTMCFAATSQELDAVAAGAGFSDTLTGALTGEYEVRFFFLEALGRLENMFHR